MIQNILNFITTEQFLKTFFGLIGGLGIFLYGIHVMGEALKSLAGDKLKTIIEKLTNNVFMGILLGIVVTIILQTSSGTTALSISLIRAGLMSLPQAVGIIMGANIGTTVTAFIFSFPKISDYSLLLIGVGAIMIFFFRKKKVNYIGQSFLGFGLLFYGMDLMSKGLKVLTQTDYFKELLIDFSDKPLLGLLAGTVVTAIVQSSSATTGIVQSLYESSKDSGFTLMGALPILFGNNIGTTITAVLASIGGSIAAKRASAFHVFFNLFGALLFMIILYPFHEFIIWLLDVTNSTGNERLSIAYAHLIFNLVNTFLLVWFVNQIIWLIKKIIPGKDDIDNEFNEDAFNTRIIEESPILALESMKHMILHMGKIVKRMLEVTISYSKEPNGKLMEEAKQLETIINTLDRKIHDYLVKMISYVDEDHSKVLNKYLDTIRDLERIGDHCENIIEVWEYIYENKGIITQEAWEDLDLMYNTISSMVDDSLIVIDKSDKVVAEQILKVEDSVDRLEKKARKRHTIRVNEGVCTSETGINFVELLSNLERIGDHCCNISEYCLNEEYYVIIDEPETDLNNINKDVIKINIKPYK